LRRSFTRSLRKELKKELHKELKAELHKELKKELHKELKKELHKERKAELHKELKKGPGRGWRTTRRRSSSTARCRWRRERGRVLGEGRGKEGRS